MSIDPALSRSASAQLVPRSVVSSRLGTVHPRPEILSGLRATRLTPLPSTGVLYLTPQGHLHAVHETHDPHLVKVIEFTGTGRALWAEVAAVYPSIKPGSPALPRFWIVVEPSGSGYPPSLGILDLQEMQIIEWGSGRRELEARRDHANRCPGSYLAEVERAARAAALSELLRHLDDFGSAPSHPDQGIV